MNQYLVIVKTTELPGWKVIGTFQDTFTASAIAKDAVIGGHHIGSIVIDTYGVSIVTSFGVSP